MPRPTTLTQLWARAAGLCSHPNCRKRLVFDADDSGRPSSIGEAAHIVAQSAAGPRGDPARSPAELDALDNLILLCANHHTTVDAQPDIYTVDTLRAWKAEHEAWIESLTSGAPARAPWTVFIHEEVAWIHTTEACKALDPGAAVTEVHPFRARIAGNNWTAAAAVERRSIELVIAATPPDRRRFAIFSTGRIPLAVQLGYILGDRSRVALFQFDRDRGSWSWDESAPPGAPPSFATSECPGGLKGEAVIRVSLSAPIDPHPDLRAEFEIDIRVPDPSVRWLRSPQQLADLSRVYEEALAAIRAHGSRRIHLFYAGPAPGAIAFGRAYNPRMNPSLALYEYNRESPIPYECAFTLNDR